MPLRVERTRPVPAGSPASPPARNPISSCWIDLTAMSAPGAACSAEWLNAPAVSMTSKDSRPRKMNVEVTPGVRAVNVSILIPRDEL